MATKVSLTPRDDQVVAPGGAIERVTRWVMATPAGEVVFDHSPTDDEVLDVLESNVRELVPTRNIERLLDAVQERATEWYVVKALIDDIEAKGEATGPQITKARARAEDVLRQRARDALVRLIQAVA